MLAALRALEGEYDFDVTVIDVDANEDLVSRYDELVPVLTGSKAGPESEVQLCHYFLDLDRVRAFLAEN
jgi:hypothetical protein